MPSPRNLDPKFKDEKDMPETSESNDWEKQNKADDETMIVHRQPVYKPDGTTEVIEHGPMPRSEWEEYEKENGL